MAHQEHLLPPLVGPEQMQKYGVAAPLESLRIVRLAECPRGRVEFKQRHLVYFSVCRIRQSCRGSRDERENTNMEAMTVMRSRQCAKSCASVDIVR